MKHASWDFESAYDWVKGSNSNKRPHLLLGNGFSVAHNPKIFSYNALLDHVRNEDRLSSLSESFFAKLDTTDFELVIRQLSEAATALEILDAKKHKDEVKELHDESAALKELLAQALASLHPDRPSDIPDEAYHRVREFINKHEKLYTANYDLLLYWALMQDDKAGKFQPSDDGFRSPQHDAPYVVWDHLKPHSQRLHYLHGALHIYRDTENAELQKLTWIRTQEALIDQIRQQLIQNRFPLIVAEGSSTDKLAKIQTSDYLAKGLRSLASITGGVIAYGLSFSPNDSHISNALINSRIERLAVSLYGDTNLEANAETIKAVNRIAADRMSLNQSAPLEVKFFNAESVPLW